MPWTSLWPMPPCVPGRCCQTLGPGQEAVLDLLPGPWLSAVAEPSWQALGGRVPGGQSVLHAWSRERRLLSRPDATTRGIRRLPPLCRGLPGGKRLPSPPGRDTQGNPRGDSGEASLVGGDAGSGDGRFRHPGRDVLTPLAGESWRAVAGGVQRPRRSRAYCEGPGESHLSTVSDL